MHNSNTTRGKKVNLPVRITHVQEHDDPIALENPFTIHPLPSLEENMNSNTSMNEMSQTEQISFEPVGMHEFQESVSQLPPVETVPPLSSFTPPSTSVFAVPSPKMEETEQVSPLDAEQPVAAAQSQLLQSDQLNTKDLIKVNFATFVELVASQDMEKVIEQHANQELIMSPNLLSKLASLRDNREEKKIPLVFLVGIAIGVVLTYIFFSTSG